MGGANGGFGGNTGANTGANTGGFGGMDMNMLNQMMSGGAR